MEEFPKEDWEKVSVKKEGAKAGKKTLFKATPAEKGLVLQLVASREDNNFLVGKKKKERRDAVWREIQKKISNISVYGLEQVVKNAMAGYEDHLQKEASSTGGGVAQVQDFGNAFAAVKKIYEQKKKAEEGFFFSITDFVSEFFVQPRRPRSRRTKWQRPALHEE
jgi:uncharacterized radical SAM superfamily Fe-S cluster-containing enzyme